MEHNYSQPITRFSKLNHVRYCAIAYARGDIEDFCRHFFLAIMDRRNHIIFETPITPIIQQLTRWTRNNINRAIQKMVKRGELVRRGYKEIQFNPMFGNRAVIIDEYYLGYDGETPDLDEDQRELVKEIDRLIKTEPAYAKKITHTKDEEMKQLIQKVGNLEDQNKKIMEALDFLISRAKGEDVETAKTMLRLVKNDD